MIQCHSDIELKAGTVNDSKKRGPPIAHRDQLNCQLITEQL
jgi:hypothetical protein